MFEKEERGRTRITSADSQGAAAVGVRKSELPYLLLSSALGGLWDSLHVIMNQIESALKHVHSEFGLHHIEPSLKAGFDALQKAHDAIHEFMYLAPLCFPNDEHEVGWEDKSAFLLYHWEIFNHAHRSSIEALCTYYNVAFVLLRTTLELLFKGAFWQCLSQKRFRDSLSVLDNSPAGKEIKNWLRAIFEASPSIENELERVSAGIFDKVGHRIKDRSFRLPVKTIIQQLDQWGVFSLFCSH